MKMNRFADTNFLGHHRHLSADDPLKNEVYWYIIALISVGVVSIWIVIITYLWVCRRQTFNVLKQRKHGPAMQQLAVGHSRPHITTVPRLTTQPPSSAIKPVPLRLSGTTGMSRKEYFSRP